MGEIRETFPLEIGNQTIQIPHLSFWDLEQYRSQMEELERSTDWIQTPKMALRIFAMQLCGDDSDKVDETLTKLQRQCTIGQMRNMLDSYNRFLVASGFVAPGEAQAATGNPGTGTSTDSSPTSQSGESAAGIQSASSVH